MNHPTLRRMALMAASAVVAFVGLSTSAHAGTNVGVSIGVNEPGFYGRVEIGNHPPPRVIYTQPVIIQQSPVAVVQRPIYLRVPPGHARNWSKHCNRWRACGQPVYFVQPTAVVMHDHRYDDRRDWRDDRRDDRRGDRHDRHDRHDHGKHKGHGKGHDRH